MFDAILNFIFELAEGVLSILPDSPFANLTIGEDLKPFTKIMSWINYFVPVGIMLNILGIYLVGVLIWYGIRWILRIAQYID